MNIAIILLGGNGNRFGYAVPKQFLVFQNKPLYIYTLETFNNNQNIDQIIVVSKGEYINQILLDLKTYKLNKVSDVISGGKTRQESVFKGLHCKYFNDDDVILIHDGDRVNVSNEIVDNNIKAIRNNPAVLTAYKETDTVYLKNDDKSLTRLDRNSIYHAQTPQTFKYILIKNLHEKYQNQNFTDDISLAIEEGIKPFIVSGNKNNIKITIPEDLEILGTIKN
ncbi:MAG: 2-C-methyl-D-erythritol 4-phosphate cytidylyltransferase [Bacilli bacterium]|nr:2-C-methyl-D-erythritol 4-phosphate cytidylyltransferase [Bacilli bacterium]